MYLTNDKHSNKDSLRNWKTFSYNSKSNWYALPNLYLRKTVMSVENAPLW